MTDKDIIKALETIERDCVAFDIDGNSLVYIRSENAKAILDLIKRQQAEIESLKKAYEIYEESSGLKWAKAEAIKEFADRLKHGQYYDLNYCEWVVEVGVSEIDDLVKEMTEVKDDVNEHMG